MFGSPLTLLTIGSASFTLEVGGQTGTLSIPFNESTYTHLDVINRDTFSASLKDFFEKNKLSKLNVVIYFPDQACYLRDIQLKDGAQLEVLKNTFLDEVPFEEVLSKQYVDPKTKTTRIAAVNKIVVDLLQIALESTNNRLIAVIPDNIASFVSNKEIANPDIHTYLGNEGQLRSVTMLDLNEHIDEPQNVEKAGFSVLIKNRIFQLILIFTTFLAAGILILMAFGLIKNPFEKPKIKPTPTPVVVESETALEDASKAAQVASPTAEVAEELEPRSRFLIEITNGTGTVGEATKVDELLTEKGFQTKVLPTRPPQINKDAKVAVGSEVPLGYKDEIIEALQTIFANVIAVDGTALSPKTIAVTTGAQK